MKDDDSRVVGQHRPWPDTIQETKRLLKIALGFTLVAIGAAMLVLPGPGCLTIGIGLAVLATEFSRARHLLNGLRKKAIKLGEVCFGRN